MHVILMKKDFTCLASKELRKEMIEAPPQTLLNIYSDILRCFSLKPRELSHRLFIHFMALGLS